MAKKRITKMGSTAHYYGSYQKKCAISFHDSLKGSDGYITKDTEYELTKSGEKCVPKITKQGTGGDWPLS